jgi:hypothetical protein
MRILFMLALVLSASMVFGATPTTAAQRCLKWEFHTQKPAVCKIWGGTVAGTPKPTHLPKDEKIGNKCKAGLC